MHGHPEAVRVRLIDHGSGHVERHFGGRAEIVVHADLDEVRRHGRDPVHLGTGRLRRGRGDDRTGHAQARSVERASRFIAQPHPDLAIAAKTGNGRDAVVGVLPQLPDEVRFRVEAWIGLETLSVADMSVGVDEARHDRPAGQVDDRRLVWRCHVRHRTSGGNATIAHDDRSLFSQHGAPAVDEPGSDKGRG